MPSSADLETIIDESHARSRPDSMLQNAAFFKLFLFPLQGNRVKKYVTMG
jgi:hypothetical protein